MINKSGRCEEELSGRFKYVLKNMVLRMGSRKLISFLWDGLKAPTRNFVWSSKEGIDFWG